MGQELLYPSPTPTVDSNRILHIISRMEWYGHLEGLLLHGEEGNLQKRELKTRILSLYTAVLSYLIETVLSHKQKLSLLCAREVSDEIPTFQCVTDSENALPSFIPGWSQFDSETQPKTTGIDPNIPGDAMEKVLARTRELLPAVVYASRYISSDNAEQREVMNNLHGSLFRDDGYKRFRNWDEPGVQIVWISGIDGYAKTLLLYGAIEAFSKEFDSRCLSFSFERSTRWFHGIIAALQDLIWHIIANQPPLIRHLEATSINTGRKRFEHPNDFLALSRVFYDMILDPLFPQTYCIVDFTHRITRGTTNQRTNDLVDLIIRSTSISNKIRWLVTGDIGELTEREFTRYGGRHIDIRPASLLFELITSSYVQYQVSKLAQLKYYDKELRELVSQKLHHQAECGFVWIDIACEIL